MFGVNFRRAAASLERSHAELSGAEPTARVRRIALLRSGRRHGSITRFFTPWDIGELTQPFLFLGHFEFAPGWQPLLAVHPQPGVATLTLLLSGTLRYEDADGHERTVHAGGFKWTTPGERVRHDRGRAVAEPLRALQLWVGLPPARENDVAVSDVAESQYIVPWEAPEEGPVRVILGQFGRARSDLTPAPLDINYFHVNLKNGERWRYLAPDWHNVTWLAVVRGGVRSSRGERVCREQIALFGDSQGVIELQADGETSFVLGSTRRRAHPSQGDIIGPEEANVAAVTPGVVGRQRTVRVLGARKHC